MLLNTKFADSHVIKIDYGVRNKAIAPGKSQKSNKRRAMFIPDSRVAKDCLCLEQPKKAVFLCNFILMAVEFNILQDEFHVAQGHNISSLK
jgi:hypothetical protein